MSWDIPFIGQRLKKALQRAELAERTVESLKKQSDLSNDQKNRTLAILESMIEGVLVIDKNQKVLIMNGALARMIGVKPGYAESRYYWEIIRDPVLNEMIKLVLRDRAAQTSERSLLLSDKTFEIQVSPVVGTEELLGAVAVFHDVTRLKELERMRSEFVANVSHELKTPLTSILGYVETLKEGAVDDRANRGQFLSTIEEHAKKLDRLVEDLLLLSRLESDKDVMRPEEVNLEHLLRRVTALFDRAVKQKNIKLIVEISPTPFIVKADTRSLEVALSNLIDNAVKYSDAGGQVFVRASYEGGSVKVRVSDTGIGIPAADLPRIFERFYRVDKSRTRDTGGTGLGLSIVKHIAERHLGRIEAESTPENGTIFTLTLPKTS